MSVVITGVEPNSIAQKKKISPGDTLLHINGHDIADVLDYRFYIAEKSVTAELLSDGKPVTVSFTKQQYEDIGLEFSTYLMDEKRSCRNNCVFCFIDQLPPGLRESLYFKDDDARLSFLMGNYITLTNLTERDVARIIEMRISPVNISVHTTNPELRVRMMRNKNAGKVLEILPRLAKAGIKINCQLVLCPGLNDGAELTRSLNDLAALHPSVENIAVVPVGLTKYREGLAELRPYTPADAAAVVQTVEAFGKRSLKAHGTRLAFAADEFYLKAGLAVPGADFYEAFNQLENGVGLLALLQSEFESAIRQCDLEDGLPQGTSRGVAIATGVAAAPFLDKLARMAQNSLAGLTCRVYPIINEFFGERITVAGLVTGADLVAQLKGRTLYDELLIPSVMLKSDSDLFLDDLSVGQVAEQLGVKVTPVDCDGYALLDAITGL